MARDVFLPADDHDERVKLDPKLRHFAGKYNTAEYWKWKFDCLKDEAGAKVYSLEAGLANLREQYQALRERVYDAGCEDEVWPPHLREEEDYGS